VIRSVSMGPSALHESGHFYFAQTGHSHFAATRTEMIQVVSQILPCRGGFVFLYGP
jgi:hypothetical protein